MDAKALVDILVDKLSEIKAKTLCYTLGHLDFGELLDTLAHTLNCRLRNVLAPFFKFRQGAHTKQYRGRNTCRHVN